MHLNVRNTAEKNVNLGTNQKYVFFYRVMFNCDLDYIYFLVPHCRQGSFIIEEVNYTKFPNYKYYSAYVCMIVVLDHANIR